MNRPTIIGYLLAIFVAASLYSLKFPLAWLLGPLIVSAVLSFSGFELKPPITLRRFGQLGVGTAVGLKLTAPVLSEAAFFLPLMVFSSIFTITISAIFSVILARLANIDQKTAFFANLPGGLAEMGNIGHKVGARPEPIAVVQSLRIALVMLVVPSMLVAFGLAGAAVPQEGDILELKWTVTLFAVSAVSAYLISLLRFNNPWMIGALLCTAVFTALGVVSGRMPNQVFWVAQLVLGFAVGSRFSPTMIGQLVRISAAGCVVIVMVGASMIIYAVLITGLTSLNFTTVALSTSPGGTSEMVATAQNLHLSVAVVVGFHVIRSFLVNGFATHCYAAFERSGVQGLISSWVGPRSPDACPSEGNDT